MPVSAAAAASTIPPMFRARTKPPVPFDPRVALDADLDDRFIPVRAADLAKLLASDHETFGELSGQLAAVTSAMIDWFEVEAARVERETCDAYHPYCPDRDTQPLAGISPAPCELSAITERVAFLAGKANFEELSPAQIEAAVQAANALGLRVRLRPERIDLLRVWVRGRGRAEMIRRIWWNPLRGRAEQVSVYRRLLVACKLHDDPALLLKLFKNIPMQDVEALLPHAEVTMTLWDRLKVWGGGAGAIGTTATKLLSGAVTILALTKLLWILIIGLGTLTVRTVLGYRRAQDRRDFERTRNLYYQNLTNNLGVVNSLVHLVLDEELKEALLAYALCASPSGGPADEGDLARRAQRYLADRLAIRVDFDTPDALQTLTRLNLWSDRTSFQVVPPAEAVQRLSLRPRASPQFRPPPQNAPATSVPGDG